MQAMSKFYRVEAFAVAGHGEICSAAAQAIFYAFWLALLRFPPKVQACRAFCAAGEYDRGPLPLSVAARWVSFQMLRVSCKWVLPKFSNFYEYSLHLYTH